MKKRVTFTLDEELIEKLKTVSEKTMIPQAKLIEKALKNVLKEHDEN
jgi:metal-responsive CopG/Arc/MetJ family transcriptional regulator